MARFAVAHVLAAGYLAFAGQSLAQSEALAPLSDEKESLRGLPALVVFVEMRNDAPLLENTVALSHASLRNHILAKLRMASIPVVSESHNDGTASMLFRVHALQPNPRGFVWAVDIAIAQHVSLVRATEIKPVAITWANTGLGSSTTATVRQDILALLDTFLDRLIAEWAEVNPAPRDRTPSGRPRGAA